MKTQTAVFLQMRIQSEYVDLLENTLKSAGNPLHPDSIFPFEKISTVHFARWIIAPATQKFHASLIYSGNVDGTEKEHLEDLVDHMSDGLDQILQYCIGYPHKEDRNRESRLQYLMKNLGKTPTFYVGAPNRSVEQIKIEAELHEEIQSFVQKNSMDWKTQKEAYSAVQQFVRDHPKSKNTDFGMPKKNGFKMILLLLLLAILLPFILIGILGIFLFYELRLKPYGKTISEVDEHHVRAMKDQEDFIYQNALSQVFETKPGLRKIMLKFILWVTNYAAKNWYVEGSLMGTPTIHFARWVFIDNGKRFVFFSNFDGSYDGYLGDFVNNNGWGLNAIYGAAYGYPRTFFMFGGGSYNVLEFLGWGRQTQVSTPVWYSAYPWYGLPQIVKRSLLRDELLNNTNPSEEEMKKTLNRI